MHKHSYVAPLDFQTFGVYATHFFPTDESGKMRLAGRDLVKETIGRGENGLRVEVSLKYRRLLVQKLAKESLLSAKDHDVFRLDLIDG